jgi:hypothetical protein
MPGYLVQQGATVTCLHGGQAQPTTVNPRVTTLGMATVTMPTPYAVVGCTLPPPIAANGPCATGQWLTASLRVTSMGQPLVLTDSTSVCAPSGTPLIVAATQLRVFAM